MESLHQQGKAAMDHKTRTNFATFIKVALATAVVITIIKTDIEAQMSFTKMSRDQLYTKAGEQGGGHAAF